ncbi:MAG: hypothetical protein WAM60_01805 [Candidatus Promineifilaceae bacterium]
MGLSVIGALVALFLSFLAQSPQTLKRIGLGGSSLDRRARTYTTYAIALLILAFGFFLAGVPIGGSGQPVAQTTDIPPSATPTSDSEAMSAENETIEPQITTPLQTPGTGSFGGPPPGLTSPTVGPQLTGSATVTATEPVAGTATATSPVATAVPAETEAATATPEPTITPTPTATPLPTLTPTPISGQTATLDVGGGNIWLHRSPGGQNLLVLTSSDTVIVLDGRANQGGVLWHEVKTVNGIIGWVLEQYLDFGEGE